MSESSGLLDRGRAAYGLNAWSEAFDLLAGADREAPLDPRDLERCTIVAYLVGREDDHFRLREHLHPELLDAGDIPGAVRCAFWLGFVLLLKGETARAGGCVRLLPRLGTKSDWSSRAACPSRAPGLNTPSQ